MQPEIELGPITLQTFGLMFGLGFVAAGLVIAKRLKELGKPPDWAYEMAFVGARRRAGRLAGRLPDPELGRGLRRPARQPVQRIGAGLVRRRDRRGDRGAALGALARDPQPRAARPRRGAAGARLRDRPDRLPALRRRRLRRGLGRPLGDGLSRRHRADDRGGPPDAGLRDAGDGPGRATSSGGCATASARGSSSPSTSSRPGSSASWSSSSAATRTSRSGSPRRSSSASR